MILLAAPGTVSAGNHRRVTVPHVAAQPAPQPRLAPYRDEVAEAHHYGIAAALCDRPAAPGAHAPLLALIGDVPVGQPRTIALMEAWHRGYHEQVEATFAATWED